MGEGNVVHGRVQRTKRHLATAARCAKPYTPHLPTFMYQKFIINHDGVLRFGTVYLHRDLLDKGESCPFGGGLWRIDHARQAVLLFGRSFDFGSPSFEHVRRIDWSGLGGSPHTLLHAPHWPNESVLTPIYALPEARRLRVLVTGGSGFLGSRVAWYLRHECGYEVLAPSHSDMSITQADACTRTMTAFRPHFVVHCAAISATAYCQQHPEESQAVNVEGTCHVVQAADACGARCIYMSSDQVYQTDSNLWTHTFLETDTDLDDYTPRSVYGRHKLLMERRAQAIDATSIGLRLTWMYDSADTCIIPTRPEHLCANHGIMAVIADALRNGTSIKACTRERRGVTDVWQVVQTIARIIAKGHMAGGIYNCGAPCTSTTYDLYRQLATRHGLDPARILPDDSWSRSLAMYTSKLEAVL